MRERVGWEREWVGWVRARIEKKYIIILLFKILMNVIDKLKLPLAFNSRK